MMRIAARCSIGLAALLLPACTAVQPEGYPLSATVRDCMKGTPHFIDVWGCVQARYASGKMGNSDRRIAAFLKLGDDLADQVVNKKLADADAKTELSTGSAKLDDM